MFKLPSGATGKEYIGETTRLIQNWIDNVEPYSETALEMVMIMPALLLQKPSRKSTAKQHGEYLKRRLKLWKEGKFDELMIETNAIQDAVNRMTRKDESDEHIAKTFSKLMLQGKVNAAMRLLDKQESLGVAELTEATLNDLRKLHPEAQPATEDTLMKGPKPYFDKILFGNIDETSITKAKTVYRRNKRRKKTDQPTSIRC